VNKFHELTIEEKREFVDSLDGSDFLWLEFLKRELYGGLTTPAVERLYQLKNGVADQREEEK
jgi:hypothetical protein